MTWLALRALLGGVFNTIKTFVADNWKWLLPLVAALLLWSYVSGLQDQRDKAVSALAEYKAQVQASIKAQEEENHRKDVASAEQINQVLGDHKTEIDQIRKDSDAKLHNTLKVAADSSDAAWRDRLRDAVAADRSRTMSELSSPAKGTAEEGGNCDAAAARRYDVLETACKVTTNDYNTLADSWAKACSVYGCK